MENLTDEEWVAYMDEARTILTDLYWNASETLPGQFKMMVSSLAYKLQKRDKENRNG